MDYLKELSIQLRGKIRTQNLHNWNYNETSFRELIVKDYKGYKVEVNEFKSLFEININSGPDFAFSINVPNKINVFNTPSKIINFPYNVYFREYNNESHPLSNGEFPHSWNPFIDKIKELNLTENEGIFFYHNAIQLAFDKNRNLVLILDDFIGLLVQNKGVFNKEIKERIFKKNIPESLRILIPLIKKWSIPDDSEREQLMEETSEKQKKKLVKTVWPYMVGINEFLDSFGDEPLSHEAILLGNLAELISELQVD
jgi:hypothetical protein